MKYCTRGSTIWAKIEIYAFKLASTLNNEDKILNLLPVSI